MNQGPGGGQVRVISHGYAALAGAAGGWAGRVSYVRTATTKPEAAVSSPPRASPAT
jgi:hypothetical protein